MVMSADGGSAATAAASSSSFSRGHLILKSHKPLPRFACAIPVPHPDTSIQQLRSTIVAILIGQVSAAKHDKNGANSSSSSTSNKRGQINYYSGQKSEDTGLSYSEHLKQLTIQEWRMKSLVLELRQNALIAPETREAAAASAIADDDEEEEDGDGNKNGAAGRGEVEESISGFELQDEHECALLEHGDEVNLWLKPGQELDSLRLPKLSSKHAYGLPNQPALDRSGTILLGSDQTQQQSSNDFAFTSPALAVREPAEPSSHSSSVSAHPDVQFETTARHWAPPSQQHRVVVVGNGIRNNSMPGSRDDGNNNRLLTPQIAAVTPATPLVAAKKEKPRRLNSMDYFSSQLVDPKAQEKKQRESYTHHHRSNSGPIRVVSSGSGAAAAGVTGGDSSPVPSSSLIASPPLAGAESRRPSAQPISSPATAAMPPLSSPPAVSTNDAIAAQLKARQAAMIRAEREKEKERSNRISMKKMPSEALIVGPGVQGKFGRMASYDNYKSTSAEKSYNSTSGGGGGGGRGDDLSNNGAGGGGGNGDTFGNLDAFVSFTAASSEAHGQVRPHVGRMRRPSNRSGASDKERFEIEAAKRPGDRRRQSSSKAERKPSFQSGSRRSAAAAASTAGTTGSPALELLPPMPMPRPVNESTSPSGSWQDVLQAMSDSPVIVDDATLMSPRDGTVGRGDIGSPSAVDEEDEEEEERLAELAAPGMVLTSSSSASQPQTSSLSSSLPPPSSPGGEPGEGSNKTDTQASHQTIAKATPLTKAERRYMEVMKDLEAERERQRQDEKMRREAVIKREEEKARALAKSQEEERRKKEIEKWQVWEEVKARQAKEKERGYQYNTRGGGGGGGEKEV